MRKTLLFGIMIIFMVPAIAQEKADTTYWKKGGNFAINFTQISMMNWAAGGQSTVSGITKLKVFANYRKANIAWDNMLDMGYGLSKVEEIELQKNEDIIDFQSKLGIQASKEWFYSGLFSFKSQFAPGYEDETNEIRISNLFSPAYINMALGMDYKPNDHFSLMLAPLSSKITIVRDDDLTSRYGVDDGETIRMEMGATVNALLTAQIAKNVGISSQLSLFSNYMDNPQDVDIDWKVDLNMKINEFLSAQINTQMLYDADIVESADQKAKIQLKELIGIGLNVKF